MQAQGSGDAGTLPINPQVVVDASGNARAMWVRYDASGTPGIETTDRPASRIWSALCLLAPDALTDFKLAVPTVGQLEQSCEAGISRNAWRNRNNR